VPTCAVHARAGGQALPSCTGAWSSRRPGTAGPGERLGADDIGVSRVGRKCLTPGALAPSPRLLHTDSFHCHLLGHVRARPRGGARPCWRTVLEDGMIRHRRGASPEGAHAGGIFRSPPPGTTVPLGRPGARRCRPGAGCGCRARGSGRAGGRG
jgi:hypothetical protein